MEYDVSIIIKSVIGVVFLVVGWFIRESYKDFKDALRRISDLYESHYKENEKDFKEVRQKIAEVDKKQEAIHQRLEDCKNCP